MTFYNNITYLLRFFIFLNIIFEGKAQNALEVFDVPINYSGNDYYFISEKSNTNENEKVDIKLYYESLCPYCIAFYKNEFRETVDKLSQYLSIHTYPYGNAKNLFNFIMQSRRSSIYRKLTNVGFKNSKGSSSKPNVVRRLLMEDQSDNDSDSGDNKLRHPIREEYKMLETIIKNNNITFQCQHGPAECYGNKLHACAIDSIQNITKSVLFNDCMMDASNGGSDDTAADKCASQMNLDSRPIKECAKGLRGTELLQYYGEESKKVGFHFVPYILINDQLAEADDFMKNVCSAFTVLPPPCVTFLSLYK